MTKKPTQRQLTYTIAYTAPDYAKQAVGGAYVHSLMICQASPPVGML